MTPTKRNTYSFDSTLLRVKVLNYSKDLGEPGLNASDGFIARWKKRHNIVHRTISGEARSVDLTTVEEFRSTVIKSLLEEYAPDNVFNGDEGGLQYAVTAKKTLAFKGEACHGKKQPKQRITLLFCANMTGTEKKRLMAIGKFLNPRCMKNIRRPLNYKANTKAWMTAAYFSEWLLLIFSRH